MHLDSQVFKRVLGNDLILIIATLATIVQAILILLMHLSFAFKVEAYTSLNSRISRKIGISIILLFIKRSGLLKLKRRRLK